MKIRSTGLGVLAASLALGSGNLPQAFAQIESPTQLDSQKTKRVRVVYPRKTELRFDGLNLEGELNSPGEFYFQHRVEEKFESLLSRRTQFHRELLRDVVHSR